MSRVYGGPCGDSTCYRGTEGSGGPGGAMVYKDGPCQAADCQWPWQALNLSGEWIDIPVEAVPHAWEGHALRRRPPRPHYTDNPTPPIVDAGKLAHEERILDKWLSEMPDD